MSYKITDKVLLNSDEEYFDLCVKEGIGNSNSGKGVQIAIVSKLNCEFIHEYKEDGTWLRVESKPESYPCVFTWFRDDHPKGRVDGTIIIYGWFTYPGDFGNVWYPVEKPHPQLG